MTDKPALAALKAAARTIDLRRQMWPRMAIESQTLVDLLNACRAYRLAAERAGAGG